MANDKSESQSSNEDQPIIKKKPQEKPEPELKKESSPTPESPKAKPIKEDKKQTAKMKKQQRIDNIRLAVNDFINKFNTIYDDDMELVKQKKPGNLKSFWTVSVFTGN